jgi:signal transduction histidine kinase/CheY-like chemotaxis protein
VAQLATALRGLDPQPLVVSAHWADTASLLLAEGADIEGLIVSQYFDPHCREPRYLAFVQRYRRQYAAEPGFAGIFGFDTADYALAALARREKGQGIKEAILGVPPQHGLQGLRHMDTMGDGLSTVGLARVQGHELVALDDPSPAVSEGLPLHRQLLPPLAAVAVLPLGVLWLLMTLDTAPSAPWRMAGPLSNWPALAAAVAVALAMAAIVSHALARAERLRQRALVRAAHDSVDCTLGAAASFGTAEHDGLWSELQGLLTRLRSSEAAAQDSRRQLQQLFEATSEVAIVACDLQGRVTVFNRGAEKLLQRAAADVVWRGHVLDWVHADDLATLAQQASAGDGAGPQGLEILAGQVREQGHHLCDLRWVRADGTVIDVAQAMTVMHDALGVSSGYLAVATDLTAHHRAERALAASRAKTDLLSRVSHELRTPLNAVLGFAQLLQGGTLGDLNQQQHARVTHIQAAGWHLLGIIDDLLDLARAEAGALRVRSEPVALLAVVEQAFALVESAAQTATVRLLPAECRAANPHAQADPDRLRQVVVNLLSNAIKYNRPGGTVALSVAPGDAGCVVLSVQDDGLGMTAEQQAQLFEPFNRLGRERGPAPGTGIGLTIVKQLTEAMGGTLSVCSEPGRGSRFAITLRAAEPASASPLLTTDTPTPQQPCDAEGDVVLIEDNEVNALIVEAALAARPRCRLHVCGDGASGLRQVRRCRPALVLLDMNLPDIDGADWIAQLRADPALDGVAVVGLSGDATPQTVQRARAAGAADYLFKPISVKDLLDVVDHALCPGHQHG